MSLLTVENLSIKFQSRKGLLDAVSNFSLSIKKGETIGIVGESGCGKSICNLAIMGLLPNTAIVTADKIDFTGQSLIDLEEKQLRKIRGSQISMIFQDPMSSLNPCFSVEFQMEEMLKTHRPQMSKKERLEKCEDLLDQVGIPSPKEKLRAFPHQLSGGMAQRVMIAMAISCNPLLLIADEPTTALDATIQMQILTLLRELQDQHKMAMILITHDLGVVAHNTEQINVMYAGQIVERGPSEEVISNPGHPYTEGLLGSLPGKKGTKLQEPLSSIPGIVPPLSNRPIGCQFHPRCAYKQDQCLQEIDPEIIGNKMIKCITPIMETK